MRDLEGDLWEWHSRKKDLYKTTETNVFLREGRDEKHAILKQTFSKSHLDESSRIAPILQAIKSQK